MSVPARPIQSADATSSPRVRGERSFGRFERVPSHPSIVPKIVVGDGLTCRQSHISAISRYVITVDSCSHFRRFEHCLFLLHRVPCGHLMIITHPAPSGRSSFANASRTSTRARAPRRCATNRSQLRSISCKSPEVPGLRIFGTLNWDDQGKHKCGTRSSSRNSATFGRASPKISD
jgi:hypothetical protein